jgi:hypothetical protein
MSEYSAHFFDTLEKGSRRSAEIVVPLLIDLVRPEPPSRLPHRQASGLNQLDCLQQGGA